MIFKFAGLFLLVASAVGAPSASALVLVAEQISTVIPILSQSEEVESNGTYKYSYETGNGIKREETSFDKVLSQVEGRSNVGVDSNDTSNEIHVQQGSYSYTSPDGTVVSVSYIADENGFQPTGSHIPTATSAINIKFGTNEESGRALSSSDSTVSANAPNAKIVIKANDTKAQNVETRISSNSVAAVEPSNVVPTSSKGLPSSELSTTEAAKKITTKFSENSQRSSTTSSEVFVTPAETATSQTSTTFAETLNTNTSSAVTESSTKEGSTTSTEPITTKISSTPLP